MYIAGKSRADLWAFATLVSVEFGIETNNMVCDNAQGFGRFGSTSSKLCHHLQGEVGCKVIIYGQSTTISNMFMFKK